MNKKIALVAVLMAAGLTVFGWARPYGHCTDHTPPITESKPRVAVSPAPTGAQAGTPPAVSPSALAQVVSRAVHAMIPPSLARPVRRRPQPRINTADPFATPGMKANNTGYPGDDTGSEGGVANLPAPENPVTKMYEGGRFAVQVSTDRHYGYRIGNEVKLTVVVLAAPDVKMDFDDLKKHILVAGGADFELIDYRITPASTREGLNAWKIELTLQSMLDTASNPGIIFLMDFRYAVDFLPDGKTLNWKTARTPDFIISTSRTADNATDMQEGDMDLVSERISWLTWPLLLLGTALLCWYPWILAVRWTRSQLQPQAVGANELAWRDFREAIAAGNRFGYTVNHYRQIAVALRRYFSVEAMTMSELRAALQNLPPAATPEEQQRQTEMRDLLESALTKLDDVLTHNRILPDAQRLELIAQLEQLVRKP